MFGSNVVLNDAKLKILKAIHNIPAKYAVAVTVVLNDAKLKILKAIHNASSN